MTYCLIGPVDILHIDGLGQLDQFWVWAWAQWTCAWPMSIAIDMIISLKHVLWLAATFGLYHDLNSPTIWIYPKCTCKL